MPDKIYGMNVRRGKPLWGIITSMIHRRYTRIDTNYMSRSVPGGVSPLHVYVPVSATEN